MPPMDEEAYGAPVPMRKLGAPCPDWQHDPPLLRSCPAPTPPPCPALAATMTTKAENADDKDGAVPSSLDAVLEHVAYGISPSFLIAHRAHVYSRARRLVLPLHLLHLRPRSEGWSVVWGSRAGGAEREVDTGQVWEVAGRGTVCSRGRRAGRSACQRTFWQRNIEAEDRGSSGVGH